MSLRTTWGYEIDADRLPPMLTPLEFDALTANKHNGDVRIVPNIAAACSAIRNYCGWHVFPQMTCHFTDYLMHENGRVKTSDGDLLVQLPAVIIPEILSVKVDDTETEECVLKGNGLLYIFGKCRTSARKKTKVDVTYKAGIPSELMDGIKELIAHRVTHALVSSEGVQSETAGGVSITYSSSWMNSARATALADDSKEILEAYRVRGVF